MDLPLSLFRATGDDGGYMCEDILNDYPQLGD